MGHVLGVCSVLPWLLDFACLVGGRRRKKRTVYEERYRLWYIATYPMYSRDCSFHPKAAFWSSINVGYLPTSGDIYRLKLFQFLISKDLHLKIHSKTENLWRRCQDLLALKDEYTARPAKEETINDPTNPKHYWRYRKHVLVFQVWKKS